MALEQAVRQVKDFPSLLGLLRDELNWQIEADAGLEELTFDWSARELNFSENHASRLKDGVIRQLRPFVNTQPWGIFFVEFTNGRVYRTALRQVLRKLVPKRRAQFPDQPTWRHENLLFICATRNYNEFTFAHFKGEESARAVLTTFGWEQNSTYLHTLCEFNLKSLRFPNNTQDSEGWLKNWRAAFDVSRVTDDFFKNYEARFKEVRSAVKKILPDENNAHQFTQLLFNRLMFCWFLQKKGWLGKGASHGGDPRYLLTLLERAHDAKPLKNFYHEYLSFLFFNVLCNPEEERYKRKPSDPHVSWEAPFLNGGLFERQPLDEKVESMPRLKQLPNILFDHILRELFARYNFTVEESTSLDVEVALDPELLGTIFERLVTGRHETGSYYTPRPVVEFMCREALCHSLYEKIPDGAKSWKNVVTELVYHKSVEKLSPSKAPEIISALDSIKICDPACGSGAYLVTMLHELVSIYRAIYSDKLKNTKKDYDLKLRIIERNLYGVDLDDFAVNIARLRLWLSLVVDNEETNWHNVEPLPNLEFKIEYGDSLTAPDPQGKENLGQDMFREEQITRYEEKKADYMRAHGEEKKKLFGEIETLREEIRKWAHPNETVKGFDWRVEFSEVFAHDEQRGFDVVLTNPPYLRQEVVKRQFGDAYKEKLVLLYPKAMVKTADIYVAFYARAHELLRNNGVACFISSNKWLRAGYGEKLRQFLLDAQSFHLVVDFGELPVFQQAATFPAIFLWKKKPRNEAFTTWAVVKDLQRCYEQGMREHVAHIASHVPASQFGKGKSRLASADTADRRAKMEKSGPRLSEVVQGKIYRGVLTGLNEAFIIDRETRNKLILEDSKSAEIIKPLLVGDDIRRYEVHFRETYLIWTYIGVTIKNYPAVFAHLKKFREKQKNGGTREIIGGNCARVIIMILLIVLKLFIQSLEKCHDFQWRNQVSTATIRHLLFQRMTGIYLVF